MDLAARESSLACFTDPCFCIDTNSKREYFSRTSQFRFWPFFAREQSQN
jgi:hypothetical protein